jgi:hypothetical protein
MIADAAEMATTRAMIADAAEMATTREIVTGIAVEDSTATVKIEHAKDTATILAIMIVDETAETTMAAKIIKATMTEAAIAEITMAAKIIRVIANADTGTIEMVAKTIREIVNADTGMIEMAAKTIRVIANADIGAIEMVAKTIRVIIAVTDTIATVIRAISESTAMAKVISIRMERDCVDNSIVMRSVTNMPDIYRRDWTKMAMPNPIRYAA